MAQDDEKQDANDDNDGGNMGVDTYDPPGIEFYISASCGNFSVVPPP